MNLLFFKIINKENYSGDISVMICQYSLKAINIAKFTILMAFIMIIQRISNGGLRIFI